MTICSLCLPALAVPTPLPILKQPGTIIDTLNPCSTPFLKDIANNPITIDRYALLHHSSLDSLLLSAENCPLCKIILQKIQDLIHDFKQLEHNVFYRHMYSNHGLPVDWVLGLAQRVDGADGFTVLANSKDERILYLVDVFGFCVEPKESMYSISNLLNYAPDGHGALSTSRVRGARVDPDAGFKGTLDVAAGWIHDCASNHDGCRPPQSSLPSRLLELDAFDDPSKIRLWETKDTTRSDSYVTLSHCWGVDTSRHVRTTHATLSRHLDSIVVQKLPQSFQDAIKVTRHLGIRFLWIDSLCICQDDPDDWAREAAAMQRVYAGAFLTISADGAPGSGYGFLKRLERRHVPITLDFTPHNTGSVTATKPNVTHVPAYAFEFSPYTTVQRRSLLKLAGQPLSSRAWAMQERLLSHRVLHFTSKQLFFECNCHFISEDGIKILGRWTSLNPREDRPFEGSSGKSWASTVHQMWYSILQEFTGRQVTVNTDWLPALSGLAALTKGKLSMEAAANRISDKPQDVEYVAGLWSNDLVYGLGWRTVGPKQKQVGFPDERPLTGEKGYIAPTWSPASFDGPSSHLMRADGQVDLAVVTGYSVTLKNTQNPLGEVVDGWISLRASMVKLELSELPDRGNFPSSLSLALRLCTPHSDRYGAFVDIDGLGRHTTETRSWLQQNEIFAVFLCGSSNKDGRNYRALVVTPVTPEKRVRAEREEFRRIGRIGFTSSDDVNNKEIIHDLQRIKEIVLV
ncbi:HET domain-containing protein [Fusarium sp. LHS14.1]|nr:HET domain-containing protein [Fusarium sp. LHS14.1]